MWHGDASFIHSMRQAARHFLLSAVAAAFFMHQPSDRHTLSGRLPGSPAWALPLPTIMNILALTSGDRELPLPPFGPGGEEAFLLQAGTLILSFLLYTYFGELFLAAFYLPSTPGKTAGKSRRAWHGNIEKLIPSSPVSGREEEACHWLLPYQAGRQAGGQGEAGKLGTLSLLHSSCPEGAVCVCGC